MATQSLRQRQIEAVAVNLAALGGYEREHLERVNAQGMTVDVPAPLGGIVRSEGVVFTAAELDAIIRRTEELGGIVA